MKQYNFLCSKPTALFIAIWLISFIWRPFYLGFYSDDYIILLEPLYNNVPLHAVADHLKLFFLVRPLSFLLSIIWVIICNDNPFLWHFSASILSLIIGLCIKNILNILNRQNKLLTEYEIVLISSLWFVLPFTLGFTAWPSYLILTPSVLFFAGFLYYFLKSYGSINKYHNISLLLYLCSILTLEAFYFQYFIGFGFILLNSKRKTIELKKLSLSFIIFTVVQLYVVYLNRIASVGVIKSFDFNFILFRINSVIHNLNYLFEAIIPIIFFLLCTAYSIYILKNVINRGTSKININSLSIFLILLGIVINTFIYLGAGYSIRPFGLGSRSSIAFCFLFIFLIYFSINHIKKYKIRMLMILFVSIISTTTLLYEGKDWAHSWELQKNILNKFPTNKISDIESAIIIALVPTYSGHVTVFEDTWTLPRAIRMKHDIKVNIIPHKNSGFRKSKIIIEGGILSIVPILSGHKMVTDKSKNYYLWNYYTNKIYQIIGDANIPVDLDPYKWKLRNFIEI